MTKNLFVKILMAFVIYLGLSWLTFMLFETPFLFETALAEELTSNGENTDKKEESVVVSKNHQNTYGEMLWTYRWYFVGASLIVLSSMAFILYTFSGTTPPPPAIPPVAPLLMPHVPGQTIDALIAINPNVCIDPLFSKAMPDILSVDSNFFHTNPGTVVDPNFIKGFRVGDALYQTYLMPDTPYAELSKDFWIQQAQKEFGKAAFSTPDTTFLYTQVAVIPVDAVNYTVYHKIDIVKIIQDPGQQAIPRILTSYLFKDNEPGWFQ